MHCIMGNALHLYLIGNFPVGSFCSHCFVYFNNYDISDFREIMKTINSHVCATLTHLVRTQK